MCARCDATRQHNEPCFPRMNESFNSTNDQKHTQHKQANKQTFTYIGITSNTRKFRSFSTTEWTAGQIANLCGGGIAYTFVCNTNSESIIQPRKGYLCALRVFHHQCGEHIHDLYSDLCVNHMPYVLYSIHCYIKIVDISNAQKGNALENHLGQYRCIVEYNRLNLWPAIQPTNSELRAK